MKCKKYYFDWWFRCVMLQFLRWCVRRPQVDGSIIWPDETKPWQNRCVDGGAEFWFWFSILVGVCRGLNLKIELINCGAASQIWKLFSGEIIFCKRLLRIVDDLLERLGCKLWTIRFTFWIVLVLCSENPLRAQRTFKLVNLLI